ncbi:MAG: hypothetical protein P8107_11385 [Spirochaetia bacterium]
MYSYGVDIYLAELQASRGADQSSAKPIEKSSFTSLLVYELSRVSSGSLTYKGIKKLSTETKRVLKNDYITSKIDALVVCHFEKINYIIFGTLLINPQTNEYTAALKLYGLEKNTVIHEITFKQVVTNEDGYLTDLARRVNDDLSRLLAAGVITQPPVIVAQTPEPTPKPTPKPPEKEPETVTTPPAAAETKTEKTETEQSEQAEKTDEGKPLDAVLAKFVKKKEEEKQAAEAAAKANKPAEPGMNIFTSIGYFLSMSGEWNPYILPCVSIEQGVKFNLFLVNTEGFDFLLRPAVFINYQFALSPDLSFIVHYHTLKLKGTVDAYFEFGDFFAFYAGGGPFYRFDIIDHQTPSGTFRTDLPFALGTTFMLGVEFYLNKEKTFSIGLVNALDMTFYAEMVLEYEILAQIAFKL